MPCRRDLSRIALVMVAAGWPCSFAQERPAAGPAVAAETLFKAGEGLLRKGQHAAEGKLPLSELEPSAAAAAEVFQRLVRDHPRAESAPLGAYLLGSSYVLLDQVEQARAAYQRAFDDYPGFKDRALALYRVGVCQAALDQPVKSREAFQRILREFPARTQEVERARKSLDELAIVGRPAARIEAARWLKGVAGEEGLEAFRGEVMVVFFLATWCANCERELPRLRSLIERLAPRGVIFLAVANPEDPQNRESVESYIERSALDLTDVALDPRQASWQPYRVRAFPAGVVIDRKGTVRWRGHTAALSRALVEKVAGER